MEDKESGKKRVLSEVNVNKMRIPTFASLKKIKPEKKLFSFRGLGSARRVIGNTQNIEEEEEEEDDGDEESIEVPQVPKIQVPEIPNTEVPEIPAIPEILQKSITIEKSIDLVHKNVNLSLNNISNGDSSFHHSSNNSNNHSIFNRSSLSVLHNRSTNLETTEKFNNRTSYTTNTHSILSDNKGSTNFPRSLKSKPKKNTRISSSHHIDKENIIPSSTTIMNTTSNTNNNSSFLKPLKTKTSNLTFELNKNSSGLPKKIKSVKLKTNNILKSLNTSSNQVSLLNTSLSTHSSTKRRISTSSSNNSTINKSTSSSSSVSLKKKPKVLSNHNTTTTTAQSSSSSQKIKNKKFSNQVFMVNKKSYLILSLIGSGGSSKVYKVFSKDKKIYALKRIELKQEEKGHIANYRSEIRLLQRMKNKPRVIQLIDYEEVLSQGLIYMIFEYGEIDLSQLMKRAKSKNRQLTATEVKHYWHQILECVKICHIEKVIHLDLKPPNFVFVGAELKIIDFGIAKSCSVSNNTTSVIRDKQVGTLNYMSPESIMDMEDNSGNFKLNRSSDIWSLGCILYQMVYGKAPFAHILKVFKKLHSITNSKYQISYNFTENNLHQNEIYLIDCLKQMLNRDPKKRPTIDQLLNHPYLTGIDHTNSIANNTTRNNDYSKSYKLNYQQLQTLWQQFQKINQHADQSHEILTNSMMDHLNNIIKLTADDDDQNKQHKEKK